MESSLKELSRYRFDCACEDLNDAKLLLDAKSFKSSVNRSYYAIFHALRAVIALDGFDTSKHSGVIAYVNKNYVKEGIFDKSLSKMLDTAYRLRERADYKDFEVISRNMAEEQLRKAEKIIEMIARYLKEKWSL
nr:HEPN domain-containing protein [uncultured Schaedlerella sp.]